MDNNGSGRISKLTFLLIVAIVATLYLRLGRDYLFDWDEGIYAQLGVEMLETDDYITTTWNGDPWFEKPPGVAWISAIGIGLFGHNSFGARALMPLFAAITLVSIFKLSRRLYSELTGLLSVLTISNFDLFLSRSRGLNTDGPLLASITTTAYLAAARHNPLLISLSISAGVLLKGLAGLFSIIIILPLYTNRLKDFTKIIIYTTLFSLPWHIYTYVKFGSSFLTPYIGEQVIRRATVAVEYHVGNRWFYIIYLIETLGVGVLILSSLGLVLATWISLSRSKNNTKSILLLWWFCIVFSIITLFKTKLVWYSLPLLVPLGIGIAYLFSYLIKSISSKIFTVSILLIFIIQTFLHLTHSVEISKAEGTLTNRVRSAIYLSNFTTTDRIHILVPKIERVFSEIMPEEQRLSSSFRYGGMPNVLFYIRKPVTFYYSEQDFLNFWDSAPDHPYAIVPNEDLTQIPQLSVVLFESSDFLVIKRTDLYIINKLKMSGLRTNLSNKEL